MPTMKGFSLTKQRVGKREAQCCIQLLDGVALDAGQDVRVCVQCDRNGRVSESLADDLGVDPLFQQLRRVGVTEVMEAKTVETRASHQRGKSAREIVVRLERSTPEKSGIEPSRPMMAPRPGRRRRPCPPPWRRRGQGRNPRRPPIRPR